jgi:succinoglycan biosynthesis transport protein ExoP
MELQRLFEVLKRRKWIIAQAFVLVMAATVMGTQALPKIYEAEAIILAEEPQVDTTLLRRMGMRELSEFNIPQPIDMATRVDLATVDPILEKVIFQLQVRDRGGGLFAPAALIGGGPIATVRKAIRGGPSLQVKQEGRGNTISITARSTDPDEAAYLADTLAEVFIEENLSKRGRETKAARGFVEDQLLDVRREYHDLLDDFAKFQKRQGTVDLATETRVGVEKLAELLLRKDEVVSQLAQSRAKLLVVQEQLRRESGSDIPTTLLGQNPQLETLKKRVSELRQQLASCLTERTEVHPDCQAIKRQLEEAEADLSREIAVAKNSFPDLDDLQRQVKADEARLSAVDREISHDTAKLQKIPEKSREERKLRLALEAAQGLYSSLLDYHNQLGVVEAMAVSDLRLVQRASRPDESRPVSPKPLVNAVLGCLTGIGLGLGLAFLREYTDDAIREPADLERYGLGFLGAVPRSRLSTLISDLDANDPMSEAYRTVRSSLQFATLDRPLGKMVVVSGRPDEGRTTVAANLAISYSRAGRRTVLVDTDLRRPRVHRLFSLPNERGLTSLLAGQCRLEEAIIPSRLENLRVLPSGPVPPDPGGLLESARMARLIEVLERDFDMVVLDSAPLLVKSDAAVLAHQVDAVVYVVEADRTTRHTVEAVSNIFRKADVSPIGAVLNKARAGWKLRPRTRLALRILLGLAVIALLALMLFRPELLPRRG